jgi:hypothetical protein
MRVWGEVIFNGLYLAVLWGLVIAMFRHQSQLSGQKLWLAQLFLVAFSLLVLGDTGHVGFRILAYALGDLEISWTVLGLRVGLVGLGGLLTAITLTLFYVVMLVIWHQRFGKPYGWLGFLLVIVAMVRLGLLWFPQNEWNRVVPPQPWSLYRNLPLMGQELGVAYLILRESLIFKDRFFLKIGGLLIVAFAFYLPVILLVQTVPLIALLMIPKTLAYIAIAILVYQELFMSA